MFINLLLICVVRYILLASLALSDLLLLVLVNSFRIESIAQEHWLYGQTMCYLNPFFVRYFYINTVLHLVAVSYDRYLAIVKSPLTYDGTITKTRVAFLSLIWIIRFHFPSVHSLVGESTLTDKRVSSASRDGLCEAVQLEEI